MGLESFSDKVELPKTEKIEGAIKLEPGVTFEHIGLPHEIETHEESLETKFGTPEKDAENWHRQSEHNSCAVACQEFVAEQLLNTEFSEKDLIQFAIKKGWYDSESGTTVNDVGKILKSLGLKVEQSWNLTIRDLAQELDSGSKLICGVNNMILARPEMAELPGLRGNHVVEVIGIEQKGSETWVIVNDPGIEGGKGAHIRESTFMKAWNTDDNFTVITRKGEY